MLLLLSLTFFPAAQLPGTKFGVPVLYPTPNRVRAGRLSFGGRTYQFPLNKGPNFIHGLAHSVPWRLDAAESAADESSLTEIFPGFPERVSGEIVLCDADNINTDGIYQSATEAGVAGLTVDLMSPGSDNAVGGTGSALQACVACHLKVAAGADRLFTR